jgi:hypothetical protein
MIILIVRYSSTCDSNFIKNSILEITIYVFNDHLLLADGISEKMRLENT